MWLGYLDEYPEYMTQGSTLEDLKEHLADLYQNPITKACQPVPRHSEINENLARSIIKKLGRN